jgi:hypothetical protein
VNGSDDHVAPKAVTRLWELVREALRANGDPSPRDIDRLAASFGFTLPSSTVEGWFRTWSVVPSWEKFDALVKTLGAEQDHDWKALHHTAQRADRQRKSDGRRQAGRNGSTTAATATTAGEDDDAAAPRTPVPSPAGPRKSPEPLHVTAEVTGLPEIKATVVHVPDRSTVIVLSLAALAVLVGAAVFLSEFAQRPPGIATRADPRLTAPSPAASRPGPPSSTVPPAIPTWVLPTGGQLRTPPPAPTGAPAVLYVGDQIATETRTLVTFFAHRSGRARVVAADRPDTALCDRFHGRSGSVPADERLLALVGRVRPRVVVLQFWGVSSQHTPCTGAARPGGDDYHRRYEADARYAAQRVTEAARKAGIPRPRLVWVLQGPDRAAPDRIRRLNETYRAVAHRHGDLVADAGWAISRAAYPYEAARPADRYRWTQHLPCTPSERRYGYCTAPEAFGGVTRLHEDGEDARLCLGPAPPRARPCPTASPGAARYSQLIVQTVIRHLDSL